MLKYNEVDEDGKMTPVVKLDSSGTKDERMKRYMEDHAKKAAEFKAKVLKGSVKIMTSDSLSYDGKEISGKHLTVN